MNNEKKRLSRTWIAIACACLGIAAVVVLVAATSSDEPPSGVDVDSMTAVVQKWYQARMVPWPATEYGETEFGKSAADTVQQGYLDVVKEVGTEEFQKSMIGTYDIAKFQESQREECPEQVLLKFECRIVGSEFLTYADNGDAVVRVKVWDGCTIGTLNADGTKVASTRQWDEMPVWDVQMRDTQDGWKIVSLTQRETSDDLDIDQFGANTPHANQVVPAVDSEPF